MDIQPLFACAVGMDVHLMVIQVCVIVQVQDNEPEVHRRQFGTFKRDLGAMADWIGGFFPRHRGHGKHGHLLEKPLFLSGAGRPPCPGGQRPARQAGTRTQNRHQRC
jgi:hypothetical protein